jgi:hypothetical protein
VNLLAEGFGATMLPSLVIPLWVFAAVAIVGAIVVVIRRRRGQKKGEQRITSPNALRRVWKAFLKNIPSEFRRSVLFFQPFVVMGEAGSGKSLLIGKYTDWKGQAAQFYPSYSVDPNLQIYLGSRALVQEIPATLLADTSPKARAALLRLWTPLFKKRQPIVVLTLSAAALKKATPEALRTTAQTVRGKINVLSRLVDKPVQVRVVLTHMDQVEGYLAFSQFVEKQEIASQIKLDPKATDGGLSTCLEPFEQYLPLALTTVPSKSFLRILSFLNKAPETFQNLAILLRTLKENDPLSFEPEVSELFLSSDTSGSPSAVSNPFASSWLDQSFAIQKANRRRHALVTGTLVGLGLAYFGFSFWYARRHLVLATDAIETFEKSLQRGSSRDADLAKPTADAISNFVYGTDWPIAHALMPTYFEAAPVKLRARFVTAIRKDYIIPALRDAATSTAPHERSLYLLALTYASRENDLGRFILGGRTAEWAQVTGIPEPLVEGYVRETDEAWDEPAPLAALPYERVELPYSTPEAWHEFLQTLEKRQAQSFLEPYELADVKALGAGLRDALNGMRRSFTGKNVYQLLRSHPRFPEREFARYMADISVPPWLLKESEPLDAIFDIVLHKSELKGFVAGETRRRTTLDSLSGQLGAIDVSGTYAGVAEVVSGATTQAGAPAVSNPGVVVATKVVVNLENSTYTFDTKEWLRALNQGRMRLVIADFIRLHQTDGERVFFYEDDAGPKEARTQVRPGTDFLFTRPYVVPPRYTRQGFESRVKKSVENFEHVVQRLKLDEDESGRFKALDSLVAGACDEYGVEYARQWRKYYDSWSVDAHSLVALKTVIAEMRLPVSSVFQEFLAEVRQNTRLPRYESHYLNRIVANLEAFQPVNALFPDDSVLVVTKDAAAKDGAKEGATTMKAQIPEFEKYRALLDRVAADLDDQSPVKKASEDPTVLEKTPVEFRQLLTPVARLSFAILHQGRDSYLRQVEEWLKADGITGEWGRPFLEPVRQMHVLGTQDIQERIADDWLRRVHPQAGPLLDKFPFSKLSTTDATPHDVEQVLFPTTGFFWIAWRNLIAPVCVEENGRWGPMRGLDQGFAWPVGMFERTNALARITNMLWNKETKNPQPLVLTVQPQGLPAPSGKHDRPEIILGFLSSGKSSVFAFNQAPAWQTLSIEWWLRPNAQVGIQVGDPGSSAKSYRAITEPDSAWSFYHLLLRDRQAERNVYVFNLSQGEPEYPAPIVKFAFQEDPWDAWNVPWSQQQETGSDHEGK